MVLYGWEGIECVVDRSEEAQSSITSSFIAYVNHHQITDHNRETIPNGTFHKLDASFPRNLCRPSSG